MIVTPEMVEAVKEATCFACGAMVYEDCKRHPQRDCGREFHGGSRAAILTVKADGPTLGAEELMFLSAVAKHGPTFRAGLPLANREQDRARQRLKRLALVKYDHNDHGWSITAAGRRVLIGRSA